MARKDIWKDAVPFSKGKDPRQSQNQPGANPPWSIRNQVRYLAAQGVDLKDPDALKKLFGTKQPTIAQLIALKALQKGMGGDMRAVEYTTDQIDGKLPDTVRHGGEEDNPVVIHHTDDDLTILDRYYEQRKADEAKASKENK